MRINVCLLVIEANFKVQMTAESITRYTCKSLGQCTSICQCGEAALVETRSRPRPRPMADFHMFIYLAAARKCVDVNE